MRTTKRTVSMAALALAATLTLGACSDGGDDSGTDAATTTEGAPATAAPDEATTTVDTDALPDPVAEVNGEEISKNSFVSAFEDQRELAEQQAEMSGMPVDEAMLRDGVLDMLVDAELLSQEGERLGLEASEEAVDAELAGLAEQNGLGSTDELLALLEEQGFDEDQARDEVARIVLIDELLAERGGVGEPDEQELKEYYEALTGQPADGDGSAETDDAEATADPMAAPPFEDIRDQLEQQLVQEKENEAVGVLLDELREDADVVTHV